ncbi:MAG TPA: hypothetical protein VGN00_29745 [Puia sp.]|jgi:hypothetical protein
MTAKGKRVWCYRLLIGMFFFIICSYSPLRPSQTSPYKQIHIPLNIQTGIPFVRNAKEDQYIVEGFEIDSNEKFYFLAGKAATVACFSKDGKNLYRRVFPNFVPGEMHILGNKIYFFEIGPKSLKTLVELDKSNGMFVQQYPRMIAKVLTSYGCQQLDGYQFDEFRDSILHITYIDSGGIEKPKTICFNLKTELIPNCTDHLGNSPAIDSESQYEKLGKWGNDYVLGRFDDDNSNKYDLSLRDSANNEIAQSFIDRRYLGKPMCGEYCMPKEHRKVRNGKLYMLNRDKSMAEITEIDLAAIFHIK